MIATDDLVQGCASLPTNLSRGVLWHSWAKLHNPTPEEHDQ